MAGVVDQGGEVPGYTVPLHRALSEPILLGGAPRAIAILNGTLAGAVGLGLRLWLPCFGTQGTPLLLKLLTLPAQPFLQLLQLHF